LAFVKIVSQGIKAQLAKNWAEGLGGRDMQWEGKREPMNFLD